MNECESVADVAAAPRTWWLYLLACADGRTYAGIALDLAARFRAHAAGKGSKFTRANRPLAILGAQPFASRALAQQAEHALKRLERPEKLEWALRWPPPVNRTDGSTSTD